MSDYVAPVADMSFVLNHVADLERVSKLNGFQHADPATVEELLNEAGRFFSEVIAPLNRVGDETGSVLGDEGAVTTPEGFKDAYRMYVESGWAAAHMPPEWGGGGLPYMVGVAINEMFKSANLAFSLCPMLTHGSVEALKHHGSAELVEAYAEKLTSGEWTGTMHLTEPQAGSDVGALTTKAIPHEDGTFRLFGTKIFITWGDHDLTENIIHFVLARTPGSPPGTRGISMFVVPKYIPAAGGEPGMRNDYKIVSVEHKLGIHASPTCVITFGDGGEGAVAHLIGDEFEGMRNMFTMMNAARIGVGEEGLAVAERVFQQAARYAHERLQGRLSGSSSLESVPIVEHPDVRRMLLTIKAYTEAMRALVYFAAQEGDLAAHAETEDERSKSSDLLSVLTPVVKAWCTDLGVEMASLGIQVHGGMGFIEETGAAQHFRDARIAPIYEGTNGIQAIDLVLRKLPLRDGDVMGSLLAEIAAVIGEMTDGRLAAFRDQLTIAAQGLAETTSSLAQRLDDGEVDEALAGATPYLTQFGTVLGGWLMAKAAVAASSGLAGFDPVFLDDKVNTARFYGEHLLPKANGLVPAIKAGNGLLAEARL